MAEAIFDYGNGKISIQCGIDEKMEKIIDKFQTKIKEKSEQNLNLSYLYNANFLDKKLSFNEQANSADKEAKKMSILVVNLDEVETKETEIISNDLICPICKENAFIKFNNFKISFHGCKKNDNNKDFDLSEFEETQKIDMSKIKCEQCNKADKSSAYKNEFYVCNTCNKNICNLCKSKHDSNHNLINYDNKNYICKKHNDSFNKFCKTCNENICVVCENEHEGHDLFELSKLLINNKEELLLQIKEKIKNIFDKLKIKLNNNEISDKINGVLEKYFKIIEHIINNYNTTKRNYCQLQNIDYLKKYNEELISNINNIIINDNKYEIYQFLFDNFYDDNEEKYIGEKENGLKNGKGLLFYNKNDEFKEKCMMVILKMIKGKERGLCIIIIILNMKENIRMIKKKEKEFYMILMVTDMKVILEMI